MLSSKKAKSALESLRQMIDGESDLDPCLMRQCARALCEDGPLEQLTDALEVLDTAMIFGAPQATLQSLRGEAKDKLAEAAAADHTSL